MLVSRIIELINSESSIQDAQRAILAEYRFRNENEDNNIELIIHQHTNITPETPASDVPAEPAPTVNREEEVIATKEDPKEINMNAYQVDDDASFGALMAAFNNLRISDVASRPSGVSVESTLRVPTGEVI